MVNNLTELTDANLEKRLKSLTSFINKIEPSLDQPQTSSKPKSVDEQVESAPTAPQIEEVINEPLSQISSQYYEMISEQAAQSKEEGFSGLKNALDEIKQQENINSGASAPPLQVASAPTAPPSAIPTQSVLSQSSQTLSKPSFLTSIKSSLTYSFSASVAPLTKIEPVVDFNLEKIKEVNKLHYPKLNWNKTTTSLREDSAEIDKELMRFFDLDSLCKELEVYYKCKQVTSEQFTQLVSEFIELHSSLAEFQYGTASLNHSKYEFYHLLSDYYEARKLVIKCERHINRFKWQTIANRMKAIWTFEKYTTEAHGNYK